MRLQVKYVAADSLRVNERNPRRKMTPEEEKQLTESLRRFGVVDPIIANQNAERANVIIGGHQRLQVARALGIDKVPVLFLDLDEEQERELNIRLNRSVSDWDWEILRTFDRSLLQQIGFAEAELRKYLEAADEAAKEGLSFTRSFEVVVECDDEAEQRRVFESLSEQGMKCRTLTL